MFNKVKLFTIGFTKRSAENFFQTLKSNDIQSILDTRLNNKSQLAGFTKRNDFEYFSRTILHSNYIHWELTAPTESILKAYKEKKMPWDVYAGEYRNLLEDRHIQNNIDIKKLNYSCLVCSEHSPKFCHRRILAEYLQEKFIDQIEVTHL